MQRDRRPIAIQLSEALRARIRDDMEAGEQIPTEHALSAEYSVSRATVREALKILEQEGLVDVRHGRGRFVSSARASLVNRPITTFESLTEMLLGLGFHPRSRVVSAEITEPAPEEASALDLGTGDRVVRLVRVYEEDGSPLIFSINAFDAALLQGRDLDRSEFEGSLDLWLAARGRQPQSSTAQIRAEHLPPELAAIDEASGAEPWITITERCLDAAGSSVLYARDFHRGDVFTFHVHRRRGA